MAAWASRGVNWLTPCPINFGARAGLRAGDDPTETSVAANFAPLFRAAAMLFGVSCAAHQKYLHVGQ
jgi:hypothetical protein